MHTYIHNIYKTDAPLSIYPFIYLYVKQISFSAAKEDAQYMDWKKYIYICVYIYYVYPQYPSLALNITI